MTINSKTTLAKLTEATLLTPLAKRADIDALCRLTQKYHLLGVCIPPYWVNYVKSKSKPFTIITVVGFPFGFETTSLKVFGMKEAADHGAQEIDYVINLSAYASEGVSVIKKEADILVKTAHSSHVLLKAILEVDLLSDDQKVEVARVLYDCGVDMIKTSTGTLPQGGATVKDIHLLRSKISPSLKVKASGGIRSFQAAQDLVDAGACRLGASKIELIFG